MLDTNEDYHIALPFLVGVDELTDLQSLSKRQLRQALAFHFCTFTEDARTRERRLLAVNPEVGADVLVKCLSGKMRNDRYESGLASRLAGHDDYATVARHAALSLLRAFPLRRADSDALAMLDGLLHAALLHGDRSSLLTLIAGKLSRTSMTVSQRVHWLAAAAIADPDRRLGSLQEFVGRDDQRISALVDFMGHDTVAVEQQPASLLAWLIELLGSTVARFELPTSAHAQRVNPAGQVSAMVQALAERLDREASEALDALVASHSLQTWQLNLTKARERQRVLRRDAEYRHPILEEVIQTLNGAAPANAGDLAALVTDLLRDLAEQIRTANTDDWRQYWNEPHQEDPTPKHEDHCRDALLSDLRACLPDGVDAQPEGQYANDKRSDIRVWYQGFQVPVEIKKSASSELWSAARTQLIAQYTRDPATGGYGIYLVFWLGEGCTPPPCGALPADSDELQTRLERQLSEDEQRKVSVVVVDVSRPKRTGRDRGRGRG